MRSRSRLAFALSFASTVAACQSYVHIPDTLYTPDIAGVVVATTQAQVSTYTLSDGRVVTIDYEGPPKVKVIDGTGNGDPGDLLLVGADGSWMSALRRAGEVDAPSGCFDLMEAGLDDGDHIKFNNGLRLPKAPSFDPGPARNGVYDWDRTTFCVDAVGQVTRYGRY